MRIPIVNIQNYNVAESKFNQYIINSDFTYHFDSKRQIDRLYELPFPRGAKVLYEAVSRDADYNSIFEYKGMLIKYHSNARWVFCDVAGNIRRKVLDYLDEIMDSLPVKPDAAEGLVNVRFWNSLPSGQIQNYAKRLEVPKWPNINGNYNGDTRSSLDSLMKFSPKHGGQLILWHGNPGTGKTYALRALLEAWKSWATAEYIVDPELLFGSANYLVSLLLHGEAERRYIEDDEDDDIASLELKEGGKWKLLIMEDTGELLTEDAKDRTGQGLSRLLNVADGFIGQGLRTLVLITTNEPLEKFHPAVSRPGRCAASIEFNPLNKFEASEWADKNKVSLPKKSEYMLAELYGLSEKVLGNSIKKNSIGFGVGA